MKIAILGTRGIPNHYGGFEQFADYFSVYLADKGHEVYVYSSHNHPFKESIYKGVNIIHTYDPEYKIGTAGQFIYDLNCILDSRKRNFDIILQLGYTSSSIWHWLLPKKPVIITNMDGLEWKRSKFSKPVQQVLKYAEKLAVKSSDFLVADSVGIQKHLADKYGKGSTYIAYGATVFNKPDESVLRQYGLKREQYNMILARLEPENNIQTILDGVAATANRTKTIVIGNHETAFGNHLKERYAAIPEIIFLGAIYNMQHLDNLRYYSNVYFHGHSVGGTNPSLLEAMASNALVIAHDNIFNRAILKDNAYYFKTPDEVKILTSTIKKNNNLHFLQNNLEAIEREFNWDKINGEYLQLFQHCISECQ